MLLLRPEGGEEKRITLSSLQCKFPPPSQLPIAVQQAAIKLSALKQEQLIISHSLVGRLG